MRDCLQYMLNRAQIAKAALGGAERDADGPRPGRTASRRRSGTPSRRSISAATASCGRNIAQSRRPLTRSPPAAIRGSRPRRTMSRPASAATGPTTAARYWGFSQQEYYQKADVWPLNPKGEIFCHSADRGHPRRRESRRDAQERAGHRLHPDRRGRPVSQELGYPRQYEHKTVLEWMKRDRRHLQEAQCRGRPSACRARNVERIVKEGYRFLMCAPVQSYGHLTAAQKQTGRS